MPDQTCANCGANVPDRAAFCPACGTPRDVGVGTADVDDGGSDRSAEDPTGVMPSTQVLPETEPASASPQSSDTGWQTPTPRQDPAGTPTWQSPPPASTPTWQASEAPTAPAWQSAPAPPPGWQSPPSGPPADGPPGAPAAGWQAAHPSSSTGTSAAKSSAGDSVAGALGVVGGAIAVLAVFLTWIKVELGGIGSTSGTGWRTTQDGKIMLAIGIAAVILGAILFANRHFGLRLLLLVAGVGAIAVGIRDLLDVGPVADEIKKTGLPVTGHSAGIGLYLVLVAGVLLVLAALIAFTGGSKRGRQPVG